MVRTIRGMAAALLALSMLGCDDGKVDRRIDCIQICNKADDCIGGDNFDKSECKKSCNDTDADAVDTCDDCLSDADSCVEKTTCASACSSVLAESIFN